MDDLISRQAAIDALKEHRALYCDNTPDTFSKLSYVEKSRVDELDTAIATLVNLPSAQPEQRWVPVTERLPYPWDEEYFVTLAWGGIGVMEYKSTGFHNYGSFSPVPLSAVTAWMPLPEPYNGGEQNG